ncbi:hypothetical protein SLE2022_080150 [Rubroshorea leprosula]
MAVDFRTNQKILKELGCHNPFQAPPHQDCRILNPSHEAHPKGYSLGHLAQAAEGERERRNPLSRPMTYGDR